MVQFGVTLEEERKKDWERFYIDYKGLKTQLKRLKRGYQEASKARDDRISGESPQPAASRSWGNLGVPSPTPSVGNNGGGGFAQRSLRRRLTGTYSLVVGDDVDALEEQFSDTLDGEVEKVVLFFLAKQGQLAKMLLDASQGGAGASDGAFYVDNGGGGGAGLAEDAGGVGGESGNPTVVTHYGHYGHYRSSPRTGRHGVYCRIGREIAELMRFLQLNVSGLRKILKKHDKQVRDKLIATNYLGTRANAKYSSIRQLVNSEGMMALVGSLRSAFLIEETERLRTHQILRAEGFADEESGMVRRNTGNSVDEGADAGLNSRLSLRSMRARGRTPSQMSATDGVFEEITTAQRSLADAVHRTTSMYLSLQVVLDGSVGLYTVEEGSERDTSRELHRPSAFINLATTFLYMTNYYIVGPTSAEYAAALGGSPAVSGLIIGMTPIAACFSCLLYSWWTNTCFRGPLLLCNWMLVFGNLLYGLALSYDAFWMVLIGRTLIGLGGARGVNRRYIADTIPMESRTAYSAAFVAAGALGMAFGPFLSAVMNEVDFTVWGVIFNGLTNPGWIMFVLWVAMGLVVLFEFQEPPRGHLILGSDEGTPINTMQHKSLSAKPAAVKDAASGAMYGSTASTALLSSTGGGKDSSSGRGISSKQLSSTTAAAAIAGTAATERNGAPAPPPASGATVDGKDEEESATLLPQDRSVAGAAAAARAVAAGGRGCGGVNPKRGSEDDEEEDDDGGSSGAGTSAGGKCGGSSLGAVTPPLAFCLFGYFVNKLITEAAVSSAPVLTQYMFDWSVREVGVLMAVLGLVVLPVNALVGRMSMVHEDRALLQILAVVAGVGCVIMVDFSWMPFEYTEAQYIIGVGVVFVAMQAHEGVIMSITSKIIPAQLARGTWNSGFLATEAGTFGRFVGDAFITVMGVITLSWLDFLLFVPAALLVVMMIAGFWVVYPFLQG